MPSDNRSNPNQRRQRGTARPIHPRQPARRPLAAAISALLHRARATVTTGFRIPLAHRLRPLLGREILNVGPATPAVSLGRRNHIRRTTGRATSAVIVACALGGAINAQAQSFPLSSLDGSNGFRLDGVAADDRSGLPVSAAGDVNGDGFDDVIIAARFASPNGNSQSGSSYVVLGQSAGLPEGIDLADLDGSNGFRLDGLEAYDGRSLSVSGAGDINGDGFDDVVIGFPVADPNGDRSGSSYVVFGQSAGFPAAIDLAGLDGDNGFRLDGAEAVDLSGRSVSGAGDIDGDGIDDLLIGAPGADPNGNTNSGSSYVVFGRNSGFPATMNLAGLDGTTGFRIDGVAADDSSGDAVSRAGDVNGDGIDDLIIGAYFASSDAGYYSGSSFVFFGRDTGFPASIGLATLDGSNGFRLDGVAAYDYSGLTVSSAGDLNGDGFDDVVIGAAYADPNGNYSGSSYVVFGQGSGLPATIDLATLDGDNGFRLDGGAEEDYAGFSVSGAGDFNGDGFDDLILGACCTDFNGGGSGSSYVVFGKSAGFPASINLASLDANIGFRLDGAAGGDNSGYAVSGAGDVNGDGFNDVVIGAPFADPNGSASGSSYVVFGGVIADLAITKTNGAGFVDANKPVTYSIVVDNPGNVAVFGATLSDTLPATLDAASASWTCTPSGGAVCPDASGSGSIDEVFDLPAGGMLNYQLTATVIATEGMTVTNTASVMLPAGFIDLDPTNNSDTDSDSVGFVANPAVVQLSSLYGGNGFRVDGAATYDRSGYAVSSAGDINGDGIDDIVIGSDGSDPNGSLSGSTYVVFGKSSGFPETIELASLDGSNGFRIDGVAENDYSGFAVSGAGDVNGDGTDDLLIAAYGADPNGEQSGSTYVVFGQNTGFPAVVDLAGLDGSTGFRLDGVAAGDRSGFSASGAGDVNDDGINDVVIGAPRAEPNGQRSGSSYVVFGQNAGFPATINLASLDGNTGFRLDGLEAFNEFGASVNSAGDVNGDGIGDVVIGAPIVDSNGNSQAGSSYVVFGRDTGFPAIIALSSLDGSNGFRLDGVEAFDEIGRAVSGAGDINGDGFDDILIGAWRADPNGNVVSGSSYVVFGQNTSFAATIALSSLDGDNGFRLDGVAAYDRSGIAVSGVGDINGDGFDDLVIGAHRASPNGERSGSSYVVFGRSSGFSPTLALSSLDGDNGFRLDGVAEYDYSGFAVSGVGDINGDGIDDIVIGAFGADPNGPYSGSSYVVFGRGSMSDLAITKTNGVGFVSPNATVTYFIDVVNVGDVEVLGATLTDNLPSTLDAGTASWTCTGSGSAVCPNASGSGNIGETIDLPVGGMLNYELTATVVATEGVSVTNTASIALPAGLDDINPGNNSDTDSDPVSLFADDFEEP